MEDRTEEVVKQYPIHINGKRRIRGAILFEAKEGVFTLVNCKESEKRLAFTEKIKQDLIEKGMTAVDDAIKNGKEEYLTKDKLGNAWMLKRWYLGRECNLRDVRDNQAAVQHLAKLHRQLVLPMADVEAAGILDDTLNDILTAFRGLGEKKEISDTLCRHMREMKRVYNYIRTKKQRNEMEICILNLFPQYYEQAGEAIAMLENEKYQELQHRYIDEGRIYHGSYSYHNILFTEPAIAVVNFEKAEYGLQIMDFYNFLRKIMEKNGWDVRLGMNLIEEYQKVRPLESEESRVLYLLFLFPEKFWKQIDFYYNGKKSWMSLKNFDKLLKIESQEKERRNFLREAKGLLF